MYKMYAAAAAADYTWYILGCGWVGGWVGVLVWGSLLGVRHLRWTAVAGCAQRSVFSVTRFIRCLGFGLCWHG